MIFAKLYLNIYTAHLKATKCFKLEHHRTVCDYNFKKGDLILLCNTQIEKLLNCKMHPQYLGPLIIINWNYGGAYILCEPDSSILH